MEEPGHIGTIPRWTRGRRGQKGTAIPTRKDPSRRASAPGAPPGPRPSSAEPALRFRYTPELHARALGVLDALERDPDPTRHRSALSELVLALTDAGLSHFFLHPLDLAGAGFVVRQSASLGMAGAKNLLAPVLRQIIGRMDADQLRTIATFIRGLMR